MLDLTSLVLGSLLAVLVAFIISRFIQDRMKVIVITFVIIVGLVIFVNVLANILSYTSFTQYVSEHINEETTINNVSITVNDIDDRGKKLDYTSITIEDREIIENLLQDFSEVKLKKDFYRSHWGEKYRVDFFVTNPASDGNYVITNSFSFSVDENYLNNLKIMNSTNHLNTIEEIVRDEDL